MFLIPALNALNTPEERLDFLNNQLRIIAVSAAQAKARGDTADLDRILVLYNKARADAMTLRGQASQAEQPSQFMLALASFSDQAMAVGVEAFGVLKTYANVLPWLIVGALVVLWDRIREEAAEARVPI
jgi:hypothetical protein